MRLNPSGTVRRLAAAAVMMVIALAGPGMAQEQDAPAGAEPVALSDTTPVQDVTAAIQRHLVDLGAGADGGSQGEPSPRRPESPWFSVTFANPASLPLERLLVVRRPLLAGAKWSVGTASALPQGAAVQWVGAGAPEALPALRGAGGAGVFRFVVPPGGTARLAVPGAEGPVVAAVMTRAAYQDSTAYRFLVLGFGFGLMGVLAALSFARWLGAGDRAAAASAGVSLAAVWALATQFGHHMTFVPAGSAFDPGLKAAGLFLLAGALLFSVRMQVALSGRVLRVLTWSAPACVVLAAVALPGGLVIMAAGPFLAAAALASLAAAAMDALKHKATAVTRLPDLAALAIVVAVLAAAGVLAVTAPSLAADRWAMMLHGAMVVALAVIGGSGLVLHHGVIAPLSLRTHPAAAEAAEAGMRPARQGATASGPEAAMAAALREAVARREIGVEYQPVVRLSDGSVAGFEALARWQRDGHGSVPPDQFIPLAEETGLINELGAQVLEEAVRRLGEWQRSHSGDGAPPRMNVNVSARQFSSPDFAGRVLALTAREGIRPGSLTLELTESLPLEDPAGAAGMARRLKEQGVRLALDDFGTGHASLECLRRLPFDDLKIDRSLLLGIEEERGRRILRGLVSLAHDLDMRVVVEGVQTAADLERLRAMGCDFVQGPLCGSPLTAAAAEAVVRRRSARHAPEEAESFSTGSA